MSGQNSNQESASTAFFGCLGIIIGAVLLFSGCMMVVGDSDDSYDDSDSYYEDSYDNSDDGSDNFRKAVDMLDKEIEQEEIYGDDYSDNH